jgi:hypothetical protein
MILTSDTIDPMDFEARTGWAIKPEGACKGEVCVPLPGVRGVDGLLDVDALAGRLGMPIVTDEATGLRSLGPDTAITGRALTTATAADLVLPTLDGSPGRIADLRPQKVVLVAWASW